MKKSNKNRIHTTLGEALTETLIRSFPTNASYEYIEDIVNALIGCLSRGEIYLNFNNDSNAPSEIKQQGWPMAHHKALLESGWLNKKNAPIVLENNLLSWRRWHLQMKEVLDVLIKKTYQKPNTSIKNIQSNEKIKDSISSRLNKEQLLAVEKVSNQSLILLSGGPGTGKTSTVAQMLVKALSSRPSLKIGLGAPTGKATRRLQDSLQQAVKDLCDKDRDKLSKVTCLTLHKWLQAKDSGFLRNSSNPLQLDLLVVDEMSMVDLTLMEGLVEALPHDSQLILVGDFNQLPPVGSGAIWHYLNQESNVSQDFAKSTINLTKVYRNRGDLALLAKLLNTRGMDSYWEKLKSFKTSSNVTLQISSKDLMPSRITNKINEHHKKIREIAKRISIKTYSLINKEEECQMVHTSEELFSCLEELLVLCPRKYGYWSVEHVNKTILGSLLSEDVSLWPEGVPVICGSNQPELGIANGDIGVTVGEGEYRYLLFRVIDDSHAQVPKLIHPARLKLYDAAFAMTIHKAQGSESKHVIMLWPNQLDTKDIKENTNNDYEKRLLYTGITRAKETLDVLLAEHIKD